MLDIFEGSKLKGKKVKAYDKVWIVLSSLFGDLHLAIDANAVPPCQVYLIRLPSEEKALDVKSGKEGFDPVDFATDKD